MKLLFENFKYISNLTSLNIRSIILNIDNKIGNKGLEVFCECLSDITKLNQLDISCII